MCVEVRLAGAGAGARAGRQARAKLRHQACHQVLRRSSPGRYGALTLGPVRERDAPDSVQRLETSERERMRLALSHEAVENVSYRSQIVGVRRHQPSGHPVAGGEEAVLGQNLRPGCVRGGLPLELESSQTLDQCDERPDVA